MDFFRKGKEKETEENQMYNIHLLIFTTCHLSQLKILAQVNLPYLLVFGKLLSRTGFKN